MQGIDDINYAATMSKKTMHYMTTDSNGNCNIMISMGSIVSPLPTLTTVTDGNVTQVVS